MGDVANPPPTALVPTRLANFRIGGCVVVVRNQGTGAAFLVPQVPPIGDFSEVLRGQEAIDHMCNELRLSKSKHERVDENIIELLKAYGFLLSKEQHMELNEVMLTCETKSEQDVTMTGASFAQAIVSHYNDEVFYDLSLPAKSRKRVMANITAALSNSRRTRLRA